MTEQARADTIARMENTGSINPDCETCRQHFYPAQNPANVFAPRHTPRCGAHYAHCTCDRCF